VCVSGFIFLVYHGILPSNFSVLAADKTSHTKSGALALATSEVPSGLETICLTDWLSIDEGGRRLRVLNEQLFKVVASAASEQDNLSRWGRVAVTIVWSTQLFDVNNMYQAH
jgi:hypothetical protein